MVNKFLNGSLLDLDHDATPDTSVGDLKLQLEAGERELWLIETHGPLEHRLAMVQVRDDVEQALREAKEKLDARS